MKTLTSKLLTAAKWTGIVALTTAVTSFVLVLTLLSPLCGLLLAGSVMMTTVMVVDGMDH